MLQHHNIKWLTDKDTPRLKMMRLSPCYTEERQGLNDEIAEKRNLTHIRPQEGSKWTEYNTGLFLYVSLYTVHPSHLSEHYIHTECMCPLIPDPHCARPGHLPVRYSWWTMPDRLDWSYTWKGSNEVYEYLYLYVSGLLHGLIYKNIFAFCNDNYQ